MKFFFIASSILLLAAACNSGNKNQPAQKPLQASTNNAAADWLTYRNLQYNFEFQYPKNFGFESPTGYFLSDPVVQLALDRNQNYYPSTNFAEAYLTVSEGFAKNLGDCLLVKSINKTLGEPETINGAIFYRGTTADAGAGNIYNATIYRTLNQGLCLEFALTVHTGNIGNYPEEPHVTELDQSKPLGILEQVLGTFKFDPPALNP